MCGCGQDRIDWVLKGEGGGMTIPLLQYVARLMGEARLLDLEGEVTRRLDRGAPCLSVSRLEELWLYARVFVAKIVSTKSNPRSGLHAVT